MSLRTIQTLLLVLALAFRATQVMGGEPKTTNGAPVNGPAGVKQLTNSLGMKLTLIPAGEFMMGSGETAEATAEYFKTNYQLGNLRAEYFQTEQPQHKVRITRPFYLGTYHVTRGQFRKFVEDTLYVSSAETGPDPGMFGFDPRTNRYGFMKDACWRNTPFEQTDDHPVIMVSWYDAAAFCKWLSKKEGKSYRLPTEAEWEYACRAGTATRYHSGDDPETLAKVANVGDASTAAKFERFNWAVKANDGFVFTSPVGQFQPNAFGLYDMHGNAWQWCADWYDPEGYGRSPTDDPTGPGVGSKVRFHRVARGGSWYSRPWECRSATRHWLDPRLRDSDQVGFRVALTDETGAGGGQKPAKSPPKIDSVKVEMVKALNSRFYDKPSVNIQLKFSGPDVAEARSLRILLDEGEDDGGNPLEKHELDDMFAAVKHVTEKGAPTAAAQEFVWLKSAGSVKSIKMLRGRIELSLPSRDADSIVTATVAKNAGIPLAGPALKETHAEIKLDILRGYPEGADPPKSWGLPYVIKDPDGKIVGFAQFLDGAGRPIKNLAPSYGGGTLGTVSMIAPFNQKPPEDFQARFYVITDKSLVSVPFDFKDVPVGEANR